LTRARRRTTLGTLREPFPDPSPAADAPSAGAAALALVAITTLFHVWYSGRLQLTPEEAYAWQHARHLDLGYLEQPPLVAWTIRAAVELLGTSERVVRLPAALFAAAAGGFFFAAGRRLFGAAPALVALAAALCTPLFALGQSIVSPAVPLVAAWCAALYFTVRALQGHAAWLAAAGAAAGVAALAGHSGLLLAPLVLAAAGADARGRAHLRTPWPWLGLAAAAALLSPVLLWNRRNGWAGLEFLLSGHAVALAGPRLDRVMRFLGLQALTVTPIVGGVLWVAAAAAALRRGDRALRTCAIFALPLLLLCLALSPFAWVKGSWPAPAYPAALLAAAAFLAEAPRARRGLAGVALATALAATAYLHVAALSSALPFPARQVTTLGWRELAGRVEAERRRLPEGAFVLGCGPRAASQLAFYLPGRPETYSSNAIGDPGLQYDLWLRPEGLVRREGILVLDRRDRGWCGRREQVCEELERLRPLVVRRRRQPVTTFELWRCRYPAAVAAGPGAAGPGAPARR
jgi:4-amino-4-deoxy-L-arabinose transferase-like glycosyltransferase